MLANDDILALNLGIIFDRICSLKNNLFKKNFLENI
jgi:hypothetical protein